MWEGTCKAKVTELEYRPLSLCTRINEEVLWLQGQETSFCEYNGCFKDVLLSMNLPVR